MSSNKSASTVGVISFLAKPWVRFIVVTLGAVIVFWVFVVIQNRLTSTNGSEGAMVVTAAIIMGLFGVEARRNVRSKQVVWAVTNLIALVLVGAGALWLFIILETFRNFSLN